MPAKPDPVLSSKPQKKPRLYYGWVIVAISFLVLMVAFGIRLTFTVFFVAFLDEFGWSRASAASIFSMSMIVFAFTSTLAGLALDRWGARRTFGFGVVMLALGLIFSSRAQTLAHLTITYGALAGLGLTILGLGLKAALIARWFRKGRGIAIGIAFAGTGLGSLIFIPGVEQLISHFGWRAAYSILAMITLALLPVILIFLRLNPGEKDFYPAEDLPPVSETSQDQKMKSWTFRETLRSPAFWLILLGAIGAIGPLRMLTVHQIAAFVDIGFSRMLTTQIIGLSGAVTMVSFISFGFVSDRIGRRLAYAIGSLCLLAAMLILFSVHSAGQKIWLLVYALMIGMGEGSRSSLVTAIASDLFPGQALGAINGMVGAAFAIGAAIYPYLAGYLFDLTASYQPALAIAAGMVILSTLALWLAPSFTSAYHLKARHDI